MTSGIPPKIGSRAMRWYETYKLFSSSGRVQHFTQVSEVPYPHLKKNRNKMPVLPSRDDEHTMKGNGQYKRLSSRKEIFNRRHGQENGTKFDGHENSV